MLHAPISETKTKAVSGKAQKATQPERVMSNALSLSAGMQRRHNLMGMQSIHGNQAVLQLMRSPSVARLPSIHPSQSAPLQRKCACGGTPGPTGECAACKAKREAAEAQMQRTTANPTVSPNTTNGVPSIHKHSQEGNSSHHRCAIDDDDCLQDEPINYRSPLLGEALCDELTGSIKQKVNKEHCMGDCVAQHEHAHAVDEEGCCGGFKRCLDIAGNNWDQKRACRDKWIDYATHMTDWTECNAYNIEAQCLTALINQNCVVSNDQEQCCQSLQENLNFATGKIAAHCPNAIVPEVCPF